MIYSKRLIDKAVLISINKPHTDNIFTHKKKKVEWRKKALPLATYYCYETKNKRGCGRVRGQFDVVQNIEFDPLKYRSYSADFIEDGCVPIEDLIEYANGDVIYGNVIENIEEYDNPRELSGFYHYCGDNPKCDGCEAHYYSNTECGKEDYCCSPMEGCKPLTRPPQSWCYVEVQG